MVTVSPLIKCHPTQSTQGTALAWVADVWLKIYFRLRDGTTDDFINTAILRINRQLNIMCLYVMLFLHRCHPALFKSMHPSCTFPGVDRMFVVKYKVHKWLIKTEVAKDWDWTHHWVLTLKSVRSSFQDRTDWLSTVIKWTKVDAIHQTPVVSLHCTWQNRQNTRMAQMEQTEMSNVD